MFEHEFSQEKLENLRRNAKVENLLKENNHQTTSSKIIKITLTLIILIEVLIAIYPSINL